MILTNLDNAYRYEHSLANLRPALADLSHLVDPTIGRAG